MFALYRLGAHAGLRLAGARAFRFRAGGADLLCWRMGRPGGEPWLLLHGLGALAAGWLPLARGLRREGELIVPETSVLGGSRVPGGGLAVADGVPALAALVEQRFPGRAVTVAGNSLGGWMALRLALARPELVARLVLIAPGGYRDQDWGEIERLLRIRDLDGAGRVVEAMFLRPPLPPRLMARAFRAAFTSPAVEGPLGKLSDADALDDAELGRIAAPTALVWGERDGVFDVAVAERMAAAMPAARLYRLPTAHVVQWDQPRSLVAAVEDFRARTGRPASPEPPRSPS
ncbi:MAG TPA: alpha/beta fold hydrolase [Thermoanaerobaculia bacterium]|nr:alpha/beta fold hydrolase [Thermoanaerobaculia bacterium]